jgi:peptidyl-prolyl cis-trans isomerase SurA
MRLAHLVLRGLAVVAVVGVAPRVAHATIVERVVAVVGDRPVLWTELLHRAVPTRIQIRMQTRDPNVVSVQEQEMYKELLERMIEDRLEEQQADRAHLHVTQEQIERGIANLAARAEQTQGRPVSVEDVLNEVRRRGLSDQDFRDEIRRQILEAQLIELRVRPRVRVTEQDARAYYQRWAAEMKAQHLVDVRLLVKRVPPGASSAQVRELEDFAQALARQAQSGQTDFCSLVSQYSDEDVSVRSNCGSHGAQPLNQLFGPIQSIVEAQKPNTVSDPFHVRLGADDNILIAMPSAQAEVPDFDKVKSRMMEETLIEQSERARKQWIDELKHNVYIDIRL